MRPAVEYGAIDLLKKEGQFRMVEANGDLRPSVAFEPRAID